MRTEGTALGGIRVLDLANEFGTYCGKLLAGLGADVIKVEKPGGDAVRNIGPFFEDDPHPEKSLFFAYQNTGKRGITLNIESTDGQDIFRKLIKTSDVVIETFPVGHLRSLKLGYPALKKLNPRLILTSVTPFGQTGSHKNWNASSEIIPAAMGGTMFLNGERDMPPLQLGNFMLGYVTSTYAAIGIMAALHNRVFTDKGEHVDISMQDCAASHASQGGGYASYQYINEIGNRMGSQSFMRVPCKLYPCQDGYYYIMGNGRWNPIVVWLVEEGIEVGDLTDSEYEGPNGRELLWGALPRVNQAMTELGMKYTGLKLMMEAQKRGVPLAIAATPKDAYECPHLEARQYFVEVEHPVLGKLKYPGAPYRLLESPWQIGGPAPLIGQHNHEIYQELGFSKDDLVVLRAAGII